MAPHLTPDELDMIAVCTAKGMSAEDIEQMMGMMEMFSSPVIGILLGLVIGALVGAIGGAIGAAIFKKGGVDDYEV